MATFRYFTECQGQAVQLERVRHNGGLSTRPAAFSGLCPACGQLHQTQRVIEMKSMPRRHACDARCLNATGRVMKCECACGGKNHGRAGFAAEQVAA